MAVLQMQRICICALKKERKQILEILQRRGVIEFNDVIPEDSLFKRVDVSVAGSLLEKNISIAKEALQILEAYASEKKSMLAVLNGRNEVSSETYDNFANIHDSVVRTAKRICTLSKEIAENKAEKFKLLNQVESLNLWTELDIPMNFSGTKYTTSFIGSLPNTWTLEAIYEAITVQTPFNVDIISSSREQTCIFVLCIKERGDEVFESLREIGFTYPNLAIDKSPMDQRKDLEYQLEETRLAIIRSEEEIVSYEGLIDDVRFLQDYETMRAEKYDVMGHLLQSNKVFVMTGFIPTVEVKDVTDLLDQRFEIAIEIETISDKEEIPILFHNNGFSNPLESTVEAYSPPGKGEIDPTMVMSLFYYMLFGLMLSDAGYGAIIAVACGICLIKFKKTIEESMRRTLKMYLFCGISTILWGIMFGSYFGDLVDVITETFFSQKITIAPLWFFPVNEPMRMLTFSMMIGIIHILTGLGMKLYQCMKQRDYKSAFYDVIFWYVLLISSIVLLLSMQMIKEIFGINFTIPPAIASIAGILAILAAIGIILTNGRESRNPFKRFLKGLYALYGISGYLSDVLSYSRLLALGLATGIIATVINKMAGMTAGSIIGVIPFTVIIIFGHTLNLAINALGAYVHTNRLQYVEFFGKFYEGGGRKFNPFRVQTKYYKFKEKMNNE